MSKKKKIPAKQPRWMPLVDVTAETSDELWQTLDAGTGRLQAIWQSPLYEVFVRIVPCPMPGGTVTWLSIKRRDRSPVHDWRHLQQIKNEICGPGREGCEIFPAESRLVDTSNQYHLWVLNEGCCFPFGYPDRRVVGPHDATSRQRPFDEGLEPPDVEDPQETEIQARSLVEARRA